MNAAETLRSIAQNDYMIDQHMLRTGRELEAVAAYVEKLEAKLELLRANRNNPETRGPRASDKGEP
jgi:hypothetical protein